MKIKSIKKYVIALAIGSCASTSLAQTYKDANASISDRVDDLLSRMTIEEKVGQLSQYVGIEHMISAAVVLPPEDLKKSHAIGFYADCPPDEVKRLTAEGLIGSFLHVLDPVEGNMLQELAMQSRLQIPLIIGIDAIHGNAMVSGTTVYPTPITQAASFNPELVKLSSAQTAKEMRATGCHWSFTPNVDIARDPRWGRVGETFGEDVHLVSVMGVATIEGLQDNETNPVLACVKHLVGGGQPVNGINGAPIEVSNRTLEEVYLPSFQKSIDAGVATIMSAHNEVDGVPCHANEYLMNQVARKRMGFDGFFVSDWMDIERLVDYHCVSETDKDAFELSLNAGIDMHMHGPGWYYGVLELVKEGRVSIERLDHAVRMILNHKFKLGLFENPYSDVNVAETVLFNDEHKATALNMAREGIVLLKNDGILPLDSKRYKNILVTGPNANNQTILGDWAMEQPDDNVVTIYEGLMDVAKAKGVNIKYSPISDNLHEIKQSEVDAAVAAATKCDLAVIVVGENSMRYRWDSKTCGENSDRYDISLYGLQQELVERIHNGGTDVVVVLVNGRPLSTEWIADNVPALIEAWEPGSMGGKALAEILFGDVAPSGKLPMTILRHVGQVGTYYDYKFTSKWFKYATGNSDPLFHFGYGLSYTTFDFAEPKLSVTEIEKDETLQLTVDVTNSGKVDADEVVQLYITDMHASVTRPVKQLKDFKRISLKAGETATLTFEITPEMLSFYDIDMNYGVESGEFKAAIGNSSRDEDLKTVFFTVK